MKMETHGPDGVIKAQENEWQFSRWVFMELIVDFIWLKSCIMTTFQQLHLKDSERDIVEEILTVRTIEMNGLILGFGFECLELRSVVQS